MVLFGVGFKEVDLQKPVDILSGGQKVRLGLAKLLLEEPDLMLMDEPTNHLDLEAVEWLEGYFKNMKSAAILVSHDRYFLDKVITKTLEIENSSCDMFHGNYSYYLDEKVRRQEAAMTAFERQQREVEKLRSFYEKWRSTPSRKDQAMSRKRQLDKMELIERPKVRHKTMKLEFDMDYESGNDVLRVENLTKAFGDKVVLNGLNATVEKGDRIALVGPNGCGKTTFLKVIHGIYPATAGTVFWGVGVERGYFSQDLDNLDYSRTCMEEILEIPGYTKFDAHSLLGRFLFSGDDVHKPLSTCSGGERNRVSLAKLMVAGANMLLLDEPTNHLDLESKLVLEEALNDYPGTVIFVSHDRYFVDVVATKVWEFEGGRVTAYEGNYTAYKAEKERLAQVAAVQTQAVAAPKQAEVTRKESQQASKSKKEERKAADALRKLEGDIHALEARKAELESRMSDPDIYKTASGREAVAEYQAIQSELERLYFEWEKALA